MIIRSKRISSIMTILKLLCVLSVLCAAQGGLVQNDFHNRIINGHDVSLGELPYIVSIQLESYYYSYHMCGGLILNEYYVLTAAHCIDTMGPNLLKVVSGTVHLNEPQITHNVTDTHVHSEYDWLNSMNDIGLIKVDPPFEFNKNVSPVKLPKPNAPNNADEVAVVSGWGLTRYQGSASNTLKTVEVKIADQEYCRNAYAKHERPIHDTQICAHDPLEEHGSCQGDSGGPLTVDGILVGLVSWAEGCAFVKYPTVFTRVSSYIDWIQKYSA